MYLWGSFTGKRSKLESWYPSTTKYLKMPDKIVLGPLLNKCSKKQEQEYRKVSVHWSHWVTEASTDQIPPDNGKSGLRFQCLPRGWGRKDKALRCPGGEEVEQKAAIPSPAWSFLWSRKLHTLREVNWEKSTL